MHRIWLLVALLLAGCTKDPSSVQVDDLTGGLTGTVVDGAIVPLAGVNITVLGVGLNTTSDDNGAWSIGGLEPGAYRLQARLNGFGETQVDATVAAGELATVAVRMQRLQTATPFIVQSTWEGFIECSLRLGSAGASGSVGLNVCDDVGRQDSSHAHEFPDGTPTWFQSELLWESTQIAGSELSLLGGPEACVDPKWYRMDGPSPLWYDMSEAELLARGIGPEQGLCSRVFTWTSGDLADVVGAQLQQGFTNFSHAFYHMEPAPGWLFVEDGAHP